MDDDDKKTFIYNEEGLPSQFFSSPHGHQQTLSSTSVERDDIQRATQNSNTTADTRSVFGGSQSASASMSANMHRIVEGVERLVESDTYENGPSVPEAHPYYETGAGMPTPTVYPFGFDPSSVSGEDPLPTRSTPIAPPGLGPPMSRESTLRAPPQSYAPRPALPSIPSIWNTGLSPQIGEAASPRTPPGLGQGPRPVPGNLENTHSPTQHPSQEQTVNDLMLRHNLLSQSQSQLPTSLNGSATFSSTWASSPNPSTRQLVSGLGWGRESMSGINTPFEAPSQPISSGLANASWANNAFIAGTLSPGAGYPSSEFSNNRRSTQLGAIGQTPPCGQGG